MNERARDIATAALAGVLVTVVPASGQQVADPGFSSIGRGAPLAAALPNFMPTAVTTDGPPSPEDIEALVEDAGNFPFVGPLRFAFGPPGADGVPPELRVGSAWNGDVPDGVEALP